MLFKHQQEGAAWLAARRAAGLWDEQGLGKTATAITAARQLGLKRVLILAPSSVVHNWAREIARWAPGTSVQVVTASSQLVDPSVTWVVTSHGQLLTPTFGRLVENVWDATIVDEAHAFKNPAAKRSRALYGLSAQVNARSIVSRSRRAWLLTGTPMPNNPTELWTGLRGIAPERLYQPGTRVPMSWMQFRARFCTLEAVPFGPGVKVVGARNQPELRERLNGFYLRRMKRDHLDLPPLRWGTVELTPDDDSLPAELQDIETSLRGLTGEELLEALRKRVEFSTWRRLCGLAKAGPAADLLVDELENEPGKKLVVFAHHSEVVDVLCDQLDQFGVVRITGDTPAIERQRAVDAFQTGTPRVAVCNIVAGGVGVTLTAASDVVFVESSFVPGENAQAADRCHRIGQTGSVLARVLSLSGSVDALISEILATKSAMIRSVINA